MEALKILWMNWRCIKHPLAGGAEVYTHEIARRLARQGHDVKLITSNPGNLPKKEVMDGYEVIRAGGKYTVYLEARKTYRKLKQSGWRPDVVIDEVNTIPFLTPKYVEEPIAMLIHQLCRECWTYAIHPLTQPFGWWVERKLHKAYIKAVRNGKLRTVITVSESTKQDLIELGYPKGKIHIVHNGLNRDLYSDCVKHAKEKEPIVTYVGRVTPYKRLEDLLKAWKAIEKEDREAKLVIAGRPNPKYLKKLKHLTEKLELKRVEYRANVPREEKKVLLAKAIVLAYTSIREGWGQTILEAAACKTPAVAYNVPGLRDSVKNMETGILVKPGNIESLAEAITTLLIDHGLREKLGENAYRFAQKFSWDRAAEKFHEVLRQYT